MRDRQGKHFIQNKGVLGNVSVNATLKNHVHFGTLVSTNPAVAEV